MKLEIKKLKSNEIDAFIALISVFEDVFEMQNFKIPEKDYLQKLLERGDFFVFVALFEDKVVGGLTAYMLQQYYTTKPLVYIYDLAVRTKLQRKGIGKSLIASINDYCKKAGVEEVFVQADESDGYALDFYRSTRGIPEKVVHFGYPLN